MSGYIKNIAVIKGEAGGFSADGGKLSGLIKCETYAGVLKAEISLINFAPLSEGRYLTAITDGKSVLLADDCFFEGDAKIDISEGFAAAVFFVNGEVKQIAQAVCGDFVWALAHLKEEVERGEKADKSKKEVDFSGSGSNNGEPPRNLPEKEESEGEYSDEAIAEVNYFEYDKTYAGGEPLRADKEKEENGGGAEQNEETVGALEKGFYGRVKEEIEGILNAYPPEEELCKKVKNSRWVKISYSDESFYVFGVISPDGVPAYICYGIPARDRNNPPASLKDLASYMQTSEGGYWIIYQSAQTGISYKNV